MTITTGDGGAVASGSTVTVAGPYDVTCQLGGSTSTVTVLDVTPALPARVLIYPTPFATFYAEDQAVDIKPVVYDVYGNVVTSAIVTTNAAAVQDGGLITRLGAETFTFQSEGQFVVSSMVSPPTAGDAGVSAITPIVVESFGLMITCAAPADLSIGAIADQSMLSGTVVDGNGVASISINGTAVAPKPDNSISAASTGRYGVNFFDITATDSLGYASSATCTTLASDVWLVEGPRARCGLVGLREDAGVALVDRSTPPTASPMPTLSSPKPSGTGAVTLTVSAQPHAPLLTSAGLFFDFDMLVFAANATQEPAAECDRGDRASDARPRDDAVALHHAARLAQPGAVRRLARRRRGRRADPHHG